MLKSGKNKLHTRYNEFGIDKNDVDTIIINPSIITDVEDLPEIINVNQYKISTKKIIKDVAEKPPVSINKLQDLDTYLDSKFIKEYFE